MRLPDFLIIGAMKCGTTTLFEDLAQHPGVFFSDEKEPDDLTRDSVLTDRGKQRYASLFRSASSTQLCGEASTASTKYPEVRGVPERAHKLIGPNLKLIYMVRDPLERSVSQFRFGAKRGVYPADMAAALAKEPGLANTSKYHLQVSRWLEWFAPENLMIVVLEKYLRNRQAELDRICGFLGLATFGFAAGHHANSTEEAVIPSGVAGRIVQSPVYRRWLKPLFGRGIRSQLKQLLFRRSTDRKSEVSEVVLDQIANEIRSDIQAFVREYVIAYDDWTTTSAKILGIEQGFESEREKEARQS